MIPKAKYCEDCKHCRFNSLRGRNECYHPELLDRASKVAQACEFLRISGMLCGESAEGFEPPE